MIFFNFSKKSLLWYFSIFQKKFKPSSRLQKFIFRTVLKSIFFVLIVCTNYFLKKFSFKLCLSIFLENQTSANRGKGDLHNTTILTISREIELIIFYARPTHKVAYNFDKIYRERFVENTGNSIFFQFPILFILSIDHKPPKLN